jgi:sigma-B regulation protein RsbU (phosphoserine phosphatase)
MPKTTSAHLAELERIIMRSPTVVILWRISSNWPVEFITANIRKFGYEPEEFLSGRRTYTSIIHADDRRRVIQETSRFRTLGFTEYRQQYRIVSPGGEVFWVEDITCIRRNEAGEETHHEGIITDISERKHAESLARRDRERDLKLAREIQQHLLPQTFPPADLVELGALYRPSRQVGGDYYDIFPVGQLNWGIVIADVAGKGVSAAMLMAAFRASLRSHAEASLSPREILIRVQKFIEHDMPPNMFISGIFGLLNRESRLWTFCRFGHEPLLIRRLNSGRVEELSPSGIALGMPIGDQFADCIEERKIVLNPGDILVLFTDGITEVTNAEGEEFGRKRLSQLMRRMDGETCSEIVEKIQKSISRFAGPEGLTDDQTLLVLKVPQ